ncbi:ribosome-binding ATPase YchF [Alphaproteobacteria bacterium]|nr:ribosome-binding ATPase YchF [Alphaproteobacteria bacterium]
MILRCGIVGLPNVGKSTLFNALTQTASAQAANYPFCTIEPNIGRVNVPDDRLSKLAKIAGSAQIIANQIEFVDIAGLVRGASKGEGLGNQFLSHIREVDAIINVVRCFEDENITHVENNVDPIRDIELIQLELIFADLDSLEKRIPNLEKKLKTEKEIAIQIDMAKRVLEVLKNGHSARMTEIKNADEEKILKNLQLITFKPQMFVCNLKENELQGNKYSQMVEEFAKKNNFQVLNICAQIEAEVASLESLEEKTEFLKAVGLQETGLSQIIRQAFSLLELISFFTVGPKECHAWTVKKGSNAPKSAGVIHTDFEKGFIRAETIAYDDYISLNGEEGAKNAGKMRLEGKDYITQDGDVFHFRFNN